MTVGACQQMIKGVSGRCHSFSCITNRLFFPTHVSAMPFSLRMGNERKKEKRKWRTEKCLHRGRYSKCWLEWSLVRRIILRVFLFSFLFRQGVQTIAVCFGRDGITDVYFVPNHILTKTVPSFCRIFFFPRTVCEVTSFKGWKLPVSVAT